MPPVPGLAMRLIEKRDERSAEKPSMPRAGSADRVDLFDESDRATLLGGGLSQGLEEGTDLPRRHPVPHAVKGGSRNKEEGDSCLSRHGLGHMGLAGSGPSLEQDAATGVATELLTKGLVGEKDLKRCA